MQPATYGPRSGGPGYLIAPLKGRDADLFTHIANEAERKKIPHRDVQTLIWAIRAQRFEQVVRHPRATELLSPSDLLMIKGKIEQQKLTAALVDGLEENLPKDIRDLIALQREFFDALDDYTRGILSFEDLEKVAVLTGEPPSHKDDRTVPGGQWVQAPGGYYVRFLPEGYKSTRVEFYRPAPVVREYDEFGRPLLIANLESGLKIEYAYRDDEGYVPHPKYPDIRAYPFKSVKFHFPALMAVSGKDEIVTVENRGYILAGRLHRRKKGGALPSPRGRPVLVASLLPMGYVQEPAAQQQYADARSRAEDAAVDWGKGKAVEAASETGTSLGEVAGNVDRVASVASASDAFDTLADPNVGQIDKVRATMDVFGAIPGLDFLNVPLAAAQAMISTILDVAHEIDDAMRTEGDTEKARDASEKKETEEWREKVKAEREAEKEAWRERREEEWMGAPKIKGVGVGVPGEKNRQRLGLVIF